MKLKELQKQEAIKRLEILQTMYNIHSNVLKEFKQGETIYYSEKVNKAFDGILYWLRNEQEYLDAVKKVESKFNVFVYHCLLTHTINGDWLSMLYISDEPNDWEYEKSKLMIGLPKAYVYDSSEFGSEFGYIEIAGVNGGLTRVN